MGLPATSTFCPDHLSRQFLTTVITFPCSSKEIPQPNIFTLFYAWLYVRECVNECVCFCVCEWVSVFVRMRLSLCAWVCVCVCVFLWMNEWECDESGVSVVCKGEACWKSVNMFGWGIFRTAWKGRDDGQELSAEVIRAASWNIWYPLFNQSFLL